MQGKGCVFMPDPVGGEEVMPHHLLLLYLYMFEQSTTLCDVKYKIVLLGPSAVGKSALIDRFIQERFDETKVVLISSRSRLSGSISW